MTFHVERIDHVVLLVRDLEAMTAFYERVLGFRVVRRVERIHLIQMRAGASMVDLMQGDRPAEGGNMDHVCFRIEPFDPDEVLKRLKPYGIALGEIVPRVGAEGEGPSVYFHDPEGNQIELKGPAVSPPP
ncbi:MAG: VOC family protein [Alphaproteobacteria bacterium]|nr:VOC family protein [Alphaproteobacteria bacterium]